MKEIEEVKLKGELLKLLLRDVPQRSMDTDLQHNTRLIDLTNDVFNVFIKYYGRER